MCRYVRVLAWASVIYSISMNPIIDFDSSGHALTDTRVDRYIVYIGGAHLRVYRM